jgi:hypothetical protein
MAQIEMRRSGCADRSRSDVMDVLAHLDTLWLHMRKKCILSREGLNLNLNSMGAGQAGRMPSIHNVHDALLL